MAINFDEALGIHFQALTLRAHRAEILAGNLANVDTPNYLAKDMDFSALLANAKSQTALQTSHAGHLQGHEQGYGELMYRIPNQPAIDGNTVEAQQEQAAFSENAVRYQATLSFLNNRIRGLLGAIRGE